MSEAPPLRLLIVGCGNPARCDDGAGVAVVQALMRRHPTVPPTLRLLDAGTSGMEVMFAARGAQRVVIVDACRSASEPGAVFRLPGREAVGPGVHGYTQHGVRWDHALYAGSQMFGPAFLDRTEVFLIEAAELGYGLELSEPVRAAVQQVLDVLDDLVAHAV